jgi:transcriptional regulator with XRE-family HTH domain
MDTLGQRLRARAAELGMTNAAVARAAGVSEQRYGNYVTNTREPDLATFVRIARALQTSPNALLAFEVKASQASVKRARMLEVASQVPESLVEVVTVQLQALAGSGQRPRRTRGSS